MSFNPANPDKFDHERIASVVWKTISATPASSAVALLGGWGTGKTDVLARIYKIAKSEEISVVRVSPWDSGHMDVLTAFASELASKADAEKQDAKLRALMKIAGKLGSTLCNRVGTAVVGIELDYAELGSELITAFGEGDPRANQYTTPTIQASDSITELCNIAFKGNQKILVIIDDLDRCPPSWQRAAIESLHFLNHSSVPCVFLCALESRSVLRGTIDDPFNETASLVSKVFSHVHELHSANNKLQEFIQEELTSADAVIGDTIIGRLKYLASMKDDEQIRADLLAQGICCAPELSTPRVALGVIARLRSACMIDEEVSGLQLRGVEATRSFTTAFALRERFPDITNFVYNDLVDALVTLRDSSNGEQISDAVKKIFESIDALPTLQSYTIWQVLKSQLDIRRENFNYRPTNTNHFVRGIEASRALAEAASI